MDTDDKTHFEQSHIGNKYTELLKEPDTFCLLQTRK